MAPDPSTEEKQRRFSDDLFHKPLASTSSASSSSSTTPEKPLKKITSRHLLVVVCVGVLLLQIILATALLVFLLSVVSEVREDMGRKHNSTLSMINELHARLEALDSNHQTLNNRGDASIHRLASVGAELSASRFQVADNDRDIDLLGGRLDSASSHTISNGKDIDKVQEDLSNNIVRADLNYEAIRSLWGIIKDLRETDTIHSNRINDTIRILTERLSLQIDLINKDTTELSEKTDFNAGSSQVLNVTIGNMGDQLETLQSNLTSSDAYSRSLAERIEILDGAMDKSGAEIGSLQADLSGLAEAHRLNKARLEAAIDNQSQYLTKLEEIVNSVQENSTSLRTLVEENRSVSERLQEKVESLESQIERLSKVSQSDSTVIGALQKQVAANTNKAVSLSNQVSAANSRATSAQSSASGVVNSVNRRMSMLEGRVNAMNSRLAPILAERERNRRRHNRRLG